MTKTFKTQITGRVQGVGFSPLVFNLAQQFNISGRVSNDAECDSLKGKMKLKQA